MPAIFGLEFTFGGSGPQRRPDKQAIGATRKSLLWPPRAPARRCRFKSLRGTAGRQHLSGSRSGRTRNNHPRCWSRDAGTTDKSFQVQITALTGLWQRSRLKRWIRRETAATISWRFLAGGRADSQRFRLRLMSKHVILLTDAHEAPAYELIEALRAAGRENADRRSARGGSGIGTGKKTGDARVLNDWAPPPLLSYMRWYQGPIWLRCKQPRITPGLSGRAFR